MSGGVSFGKFEYVNVCISCLCTGMYLELCADIFRHEFDRRFLDDLEVPGAEDLHG